MIRAVYQGKPVEVLTGFVNRVHGDNTLYATIMITDGNKLVSITNVPANQLIDVSFRKTLECACINLPDRDFIRCSQCLERDLYFLIQSDIENLQGA